MTHTYDGGSRLQGWRIPLGFLLIGIVLGFGVSVYSVLQRAPKIADFEYVVMVSDLFEKEKSVFSARERLTAITKDPLDITDAALDFYVKQRPDAVREVQTLRTMSQALRGSDPLKDSAVYGGFWTSLIGVVGTMLVAVVIVALVIFVWRTIGTRAAGQSRIKFGRELTGSGTSISGFVTSVASSVGALANRGRPNQGASEALRQRGKGSTEAVAASVSAPARIHNRTAPAPRQRVLAEADLSYQFGSSDVDDVRPIRDDNGEMIGAFGLSGSEKSDRPNRYYGFAVWIQDYAADREVSAVGLVSEAARQTRTARIEDWIHRDKIDDVYDVEQPGDIVVRTRNFRLKLRITDLQYKPSRDGSSGYFERLEVHAEIY